MGATNHSPRESLGDWARRLFPGWYAGYVERSRLEQRQRLDRLLRAGGNPAPLPASRFDELQARRFPRAAEYRYDDFSSVVRGGERLRRLAALLPGLTERRSILEVSCGDGMVGALLQLAGHEVQLGDMRDWRGAPAAGVPFVTWDVGDPFPQPERRFDLVLAYNATEHWPDPESAITALMALCKPGGHLVLDFGPLFNSPWGLHAWSLAFPYPQFLFPRELIEERVAALGVQDLGETYGTLQPTNGWSLARFRDLWPRLPAEVVALHEDRDYRYLGFIEEFAACFRGRGLSLDEVTVNSIEIVLRVR
jgi:SAM-dependent methyltransferase